MRHVVKRNAFVAAIQKYMLSAEAPNFRSSPRVVPVIPMGYLGADADKAADCYAAGVRMPWPFSRAP